MQLRNGNLVTPPVPQEGTPPIHEPSTTQSDSSLKSPTSPQSHQKPSARKMNHRNWFFVGLGLILLGWLGYWYWESQWIMTSGRMLYQQAHITSPLKGLVSSIHVQEGDQVKKGQLLVKLDDWAIQSQLTKAQTVLDQARARLRLFENIGLDPTFRMRLLKGEEGYTLARHQYDEVQADLDKVLVHRNHMEQAMERARRLYLLRALTVAEWEQTILEFDTVEAEYQAVDARLAKAAAARKGAKVFWEQEKVAFEHGQKKSENDLAFLRLEVEQAKAGVQEVKSQLGQLEVTAPQSGVVSWLPRVIGEVVDHNDTVVGLMDPSEVWVEAYVEGEVFADIHPNQEAWVKIDGVSDDYLVGSVAMLYPSQRRTEESFRVGPDKARSPAHLSQLAHPVKVVLRDPLPFEVRQEMIVWVWFTRR